MELYESRFAIGFNSLFNAEIQLLCAVGLSNPGKVHARSSRSGSIPLTRRHALPCHVGLGTIQSKLYISHPLPHSSQFCKKKKLQCNAMELRICLVFFCLTEMRTDQKTRISFESSNVFTRGTTSREVCTTSSTATKNRKSRITDGTGTMNGAVSQRITRTSDSDYSYISAE
jgi:hypothetical protein